MAPKKPPKPSAHHGKYDSYWIINERAIAIVGETMDDQDKLEMMLKDITRIQDAMIYYAKYEPEISLRLSLDQETVLTMHQKLKFRLEEIERLKQAVLIAGRAGPSDEDKASLQRISDTSDEVFDIFASIYADRILPRIQSAELPTFFLPPNEEHKLILQGLATAQGVVVSPGGYSGENFFKMLMPVINEKAEKTAEIQRLDERLSETISTNKEKLDAKQKALENNEATLSQERRTRILEESRLKTAKARLEKNFDLLEAKNKATEVAHEKEVKALEDDLAIARLGSGEKMSQLEKQLADRNKVSLENDRLTREANEDQAEIARLTEELDNMRDEKHRTDNAEKQSFQALEHDRDQRAQEVEDLKTQNSFQATQFERFFLKVLKEIAREDKSDESEEWHMDDMQPLRSKFDIFDTFKRNMSPPGQFSIGFSLETSTPEFAVSFDLPYQKKYFFASEMGTMLLTCLEPSHLDSSQLELRGRLRWANSTIMPRFRKKMPAGTDYSALDQIKLSCLILFLSRLLGLTRGDDINFAWTSCLITELFCIFAIPIDIIEEALERDVANCGFLEAAGLLRLHMLVRSISPNASSSFPGFADPRFRSGVVEETGLCALDMPTFLLQVCQREIVSKQRLGEWFVSEDDGENKAVVISNSSADHCVWTSEVKRGYNFWRFSTESAVSVTSLGKTEGVAEWEIGTTKTSLRFPRGGNFEDYVGYFAEASTVDLVFQEGERMKAAEDDEAAKLREERAAVHKTEADQRQGKDVRNRNTRIPRR